MQQNLSHCKLWKSKNSAPIHGNKLDEKRKAKVDEIRDQHKKMWVKEDESKAGNVYVPKFGAESSFGN